MCSLLGPYSTMIPHSVSTITGRAYNVPVIPHDLLLQANYERLKLKRVEWRRNRHRKLLARICQDMRDKVCATLSNDADVGWLERSDSD